VAVEIAVAQAVAVERHDASALPVGWDHADLRVSRAFGDAWIREQRTAVLVVPSVVARREGNGSSTQAIPISPTSRPVRRRLWCGMSGCLRGGEAR
jgi:RES domain-containing protein